MAGSWSHATEDETGKLLRNEDIVKMLENGGDWYEFAEEAYGMVWYLASQLATKYGYPTGEVHERMKRELVNEAEERYLTGIEESPGTDGEFGLRAATTAQD